jgi:hypothetical protein
MSLSILSRYFSVTSFNVSPSSYVLLLYVLCVRRMGRGLIESILPVRWGGLLLSSLISWMLPLTYSHLFAAIGSIINSAWVREGAVVYGPLCTAQGTYGKSFTWSLLTYP